MLLMIIGEKEVMVDAKANKIIANVNGNFSVEGSLLPGLYSDEGNLRLIFHLTRTRALRRAAPVP